MVLLPLLSLWIKKPKIKRAFILTTVLLGFIFGNKFLLNEVALQWEINVTEPKVFPKTAVVLGGFCSEDEKRNKILMSDAQERIYKAVELFKTGKIQYILVSGGTGSIFGKSKPEALFAAQVLRNHQIPDSAIISEIHSVNTYENALNSKKMLSEKKLGNNVLLITSAFHMRRALKCFHKQGINATPYSVHFYSKMSRGYNIADYILPSSEALYRWDAFIKEWVGFIAYKISGKC